MVWRGLASVARSSQTVPMNEPAKSSSTTSWNETDFMRLFLQNEPVLRCVARAMLSDWTMVDDVLQEAGITMWEKMSQLRDEAGFLPWAKVIVRFKCRSAINALRRDRLVLSDEAVRLIAEDLETLDRDYYESALAALKGCLSQLPHHQKELVLAPYCRAESLEQMADQIGKTANSLYKQLGRLRVKLSDCVALTLQAEQQ